MVTDLPQECLGARRFSPYARLATFILQPLGILLVVFTCCRGEQHHPKLPPKPSQIGDPRGSYSNFNPLDDIPNP